LGSLEENFFWIGDISLLRYKNSKITISIYLKSNSSSAMS